VLNLKSIDLVLSDILGFLFQYFGLKWPILGQILTFWGLIVIIIIVYYAEAAQYTAAIKQTKNTI